MDLDYRILPTLMVMIVKIFSELHMYNALCMLVTCIISFNSTITPFLKLGDGGIERSSNFPRAT